MDTGELLMRKLTGTIFAVALLVAGAAQAAELIQANAVRLGPGSQSSFLKVVLDRYSTDAERAQWRAAFETGGQDGLIAKWQEENPRVGTLSFTGTIGYQIRAAVSVPTEKGRRVYLATDRRIRGFEVRNATRSEDYPVGWVQLEVDAEGKGSGEMVGAAQLSIQDGQLVVASQGTENIRLLNVTIKEMKDKDKDK
jgi:hypothetical protein